MQVEENSCEVVRVDLGVVYHINTLNQQGPQHFCLLLTSRKEMPFSASNPTRIVDAFQINQSGKHSDLENPCLQIVRVVRTAMENRRYSATLVGVCEILCDDVPRGGLHRSPAA
jgi:hypothetical protein